MADNLFNPSEDAAMAEEAAQISTDPFTGGGSVAMPGATQWEQYKIGSELGPHNLQASHVPGLPGQVLPGADGDQSMGALSGQVGPQVDRDATYTSNAMPQFNDGQHPADGGGMGAMDSLALPKPEEAMLANERMYHYPQAPEPFSAIEPQASPILPFDAQEDGAYDE